MQHLNIEIKAKVSNISKIRNILLSKKAKFIGIDKQTDTYFDVKNGRLKLREGNIENNLIFYERSNKKEPKQSDVNLYKSVPKSELKTILSKAVGIKVVVEKEREIYFIENVKFHIDRVKNLGTFVEIEAIDKKGTIGIEKLTEQCNYYLNLFEITENDLLSTSYSDMI